MQITFVIEMVIIEASGSQMCLILERHYDPSYTILSLLKIKKLSAFLYVFQKSSSPQSYSFYFKIRHA